jgi:predicted acylesterase/phospholipase RssA
MDNTFFPNQPFEKIALSCSGGGYRASAFHLGSMSYLNRLQYKGIPLLQNVEMISTVSGGTITGIVYALMTAEGKKFEEVYSFLLNKLSTTDLVKEGIVMLNPGAEWNNETKTKNIINAFSVLYDENFTDGKILGDLISDTSHLKKFVFNSTEFNNGINFRFKKPSSKNYSGNYYNKIPNDVTPYIKLGDIMAASSCFPGGFEPILWPKDFVYEGGEIIRDVRNENINDTGLMDGGIYDNQGIESILNFKKGKLPYFDLVLISDVASPFMEPYQAVNESSNPTYQKLTLKAVLAKIKMINQVVGIGLFVLLFLFSILPIFSNYGNNVWTGLSIGFAFFILIVIILKKVFITKLKNKGQSVLEQINKKIPIFYAEKLSYLKIEEMSVARLAPLLLNRLNSLISLLMDVFLKITRRLNYDKLYTNEQYTFRRISNLVKELTANDFKMRLNREGNLNKTGNNPHSLLTNDYNKTIGPKIQEVVEEASNFGTTLWFTEQEKVGGMLKKLIATGQMTMCYNLIKYIEKIIYDKDSMFKGLAPEVQNELRESLSFCEKDWLQFKNEPFIMTKNLHFEH